LRIVPEGKLRVHLFQFLNSRAIAMPMLGFFEQMLCFKAQKSGGGALGSRNHRRLHRISKVG
jgi:hypothetical protein